MLRNGHYNVSCEKFQGDFNVNIRFQNIFLLQFKLPHHKHMAAGLTALIHAAALVQELFMVCQAFNCFRSVLEKPPLILRLTINTAPLPSPTPPHSKHHTPKLKKKKPSLMDQPHFTQYIYIYNTGRFMLKLSHRIRLVIKIQFKMDIQIKSLHTNPLFTQLASQPSCLHWIVLAKH